MAERLRHDELEFQAEARLSLNGAGIVLLEGDKHAVSDVQLDNDRLTFALDGETHHFDILTTPTEVWLASPARTVRFERIVVGSGSGTSDAGALVSKMPGVVLQTLVEPGTEVATGTPLLIIEAMKMEHQVVAPVAGVVRGYPVAVGQRAMPGDLLVDFEPSPVV
jgi:biotin carboxyl carrier protein